MANLRDDIRKLWTDTFDDKAEWVEMFFTRVYRDDDVMELRPDGNGSRPASALLLQRYAMNFHGATVGCAYICGAATRRNERGKGLMTRLLATSLREARERGDMLVTLIPAEGHLYYYYAARGFSTVFYTRNRRYTSCHPFAGPGEFTIVDDPYAVGVYEAFSRMEHNIDGRILHSQRDFLNILDDTRLDGGHCAIIADASGKICGIGFAAERDGLAVITDILADNADAEQAVLRRLHASLPDLPVKYPARPGNCERFLSPRAMGRIVNVPTALEAIAASHPRLRATYCITDPLLAENSGIYRLQGGTCERLAPGHRGRLDLDVDIDVFTRAVFSAPPIGELLGLPSIRPDMALMLD